MHPLGTKKRRDRGQSRGLFQEDRRQWSEMRNRMRWRQKGSLKKLAHRDGHLWWRLQWRKPGEKNSTTKWLGQCSKMSRKAAERDRILEPINVGLETHNSSMMTL